MKYLPLSVPALVMKNRAVELFRCLQRTVFFIKMEAESISHWEATSSSHHKCVTMAEPGLICRVQRTASQEGGGSSSWRSGSLVSSARCLLDCVPIPTAPAGQMTGMCSSRPLSGLSISQLSLWADGMLQQTEPGAGSLVMGTIYDAFLHSWAPLPWLTHREESITDRAGNQVNSIIQLNGEF